MPEMNEYIIKCKRGIDDLEPIYAFYGTSQGDTLGSNMAGASIGAGGWVAYSDRFKNKGIDPLDQEAINKYSKELAEENDKYITQLHKEGRYGEEYEISIEIEYNPIYDAPSTFTNDSSPSENYHVEFLDFSNKDKTVNDESKI